MPGVGLYVFTSSNERRIDEAMPAPGCKLPDVALYDEERTRLFLIEAVTSHGPVSPKRLEELEVTLKDCPATRTYITAFPDFRQFKRHADKVAWETDVWVAEIPDHLIHFNGDTFLSAQTTE